MNPTSSDVLEAELLADMAQRLSALFSLVSAQKPQLGIQTLVLRARKMVEEEHVSLSDALEVIYQGALKRTEARLTLMQQCALPSSSNLPKSSTKLSPP
jgi:hypothetical protein